jgi:hypothetical protein
MYRKLLITIIACVLYISTTQDLEAQIRFSNIRYSGITIAIYYKNYDGLTLVGRYYVPSRSWTVIETGNDMIHLYYYKVDRGALINVWDDNITIY